MILCAISQSTYFAVSYSGRLDRMLNDIKLGEKCAKYSRQIAVIYTSIAWVMFLINFAFLLYTMFFTGDYMNIWLAPITTQINLSDLTIPRTVSFLFCATYLSAAWIFPHAMSFMLATIFTHQFKELSKSFVRMLAEGDESRISDSDIETFTQKYLKIRITSDS